MDTCLSFTGLVKRLAGFALLGAAVLILAGPLLTVAATVGVCVVIGFLIWLPLHTVFMGPRSSWRNACDGSRRWARRAKTVCGVAIRPCQWVGSKAEFLIERWWPLVSCSLREGVCGGLIGALVVVLARLEGPGGAAAIAVGCMLGLVVGFNAASGRAR